jgi:prepilin-type N-terminal cleavage/methylation domain-containing protein
MKCSPRSGFSLPELLLATVLLAIGLLGLASSATFIAIQSSDARRLLNAAHFAGARLDSLHATPCRLLVNGASAAGTASISWAVTPAPQTRSLRAVLTFQRHRLTATRAFDLLIPCDG